MIYGKKLKVIICILIIIGMTFINVSLDFSSLINGGMQNRHFLQDEKKVYAASQTIIPGFDDIWIGNVNRVAYSYGGFIHWTMQGFVINRVTDNKLFFGVRLSSGYTIELPVLLTCWDKNNNVIASPNLDNSLSSFDSSNYRLVYPVPDNFGNFQLFGTNNPDGLTNMFMISDYSGCTYARIDKTEMANNLNRESKLLSLSPSQNGIFYEGDMAFVPQISVSDPDNNTLTCNYYIDSETTTRDTKTANNTVTTQTISFAPLNMSTLTEGNHIMKFEVSDGIAAPVTTTVNFKVDKSAPTLGTVTVSSTTSSITVSGSASDSIAGLDANPYKYTVGPNVSSWITQTSYTQSSLSPNTQYSTKFEARDSKGHISSSTKNIYTKAVIGTASVNNPTSYTLDVNVSNTNPNNTEYQISTNSGGTKYITQEGALTNSPVWVTMPSKKITVQGLIPNTAYSFTVKARNAELVETTTTSASGTTLQPPPAAPVNLTATATNTSVTLNWGAVSGATSYDVELESGTAGSSIISAGAALTYTHSSLAANTPHNYKVRAKNGTVAGAWSTLITKTTLPNPPVTPSNLVATPGSTTVTVTWGSVSGAKEYQLIIDGDENNLINNSASTNYIHSGLLPITYHTYKVRSGNEGGWSAWSNEVNVTTQPDAIPVPVNLYATPSRDQIVITWDPAENATGYDIEVDGVAIDNGTRTTYTHTGLTAGTRHEYRVRGKRGSTVSDWSSMLVMNTLPDTFGAPANVITFSTDTTVTVSWDAVGGATEYIVNFDGVVASNGTDTSCTYSNLTPNTAHTVSVKAMSGAVTSDWSSQMPVSTYLLATPSSIAATATQTSITLNWGAVTGATSYDIKINGTTVQNTTATTFTLNGLTANSLHSFSVMAKKAGGTSAWSNTLTKTTAFNANSIPQGIITKARTNSITVIWTALAGATGYDVEANGTLIQNITGTTYLHNNLTPGTQYTYRVRAKTDTGAGDWSNVLASVTLPIIPDVPTNIAAAATTSSIKLTWDNMENVTQYEVFVDGQLINNGTGTTYLHTGLTPNTTHTYRVRAKNTSGTCEWSQIIEVKTLSSTQQYTLSITNGEVFNVMLSAANIGSPDKYTFTITYNSSDLDVLDLCGTTAKIDLTTGNIAGTDLNVIQFTPGTIVLKKSTTATSEQMWSGAVDTIKFKSKVNAQITITYSIQ